MARYGARIWRYTPDEMQAVPNESYGHKLRRLRLSLGLSQRQVAEIAGCNFETICLWENGKRQGNTPEQAAIPRRAIQLLGMRLRRKEARRAALDTNGLVCGKPGPGLVGEPLAPLPQRRVR